MKGKLRNASFAALTGLVIVGILELGSFLILSLQAGELFTYAVFHREIRSARSPGEEGLDDPAESESYRTRTRQAIHPFLGYVSDADVHPAAQDAANSAEAIDYGFPRNKSRLFYEPDGNRIVVAVFGGSVAGNITAFEPYYLEKGLAKYEPFASKELVVLSLANSGYKQPQQLMALNYLLALGAHFDVVVNLDGFNEVALPLAELIPNQVSPFFPRGWQLRVGDLDQETRLSIGRLSYLRDRRTAWPARFDRAPHRFSMIAALVWKIVDRKLAGQLSGAELEMLEGKTSGRFQARGPRREYASRSATLEDLAAVWQRSSLQMHAVCRERGIVYYHFLQPNQYLPGSKTLTAEEKKKAWREDHPYRPAIAEGYPRLIERGEELGGMGVRFIDLTGIFASSNETLYHDTCCHLNFRGNVLLARAMAAAIGRDPPS